MLANMSMSLTSFTLSNSLCKLDWETILFSSRLSYFVDPPCYKVMKYPIGEL